jgi:hypothetical protein
MHARINQRFTELHAERTAADTTLAALPEILDPA